MRRWVGILPLTQDVEKLTLEEMKQTVTNRLGDKDKSGNKYVNPNEAEGD